ncbi:MAG: flagellar biosynthesis protein FlhB [Lachnospiraceae bacterium]|nr:flagellar biosynthesis protein FlhB [Lachnospiraceae bacterium]
MIKYELQFFAQEGPGGEKTEEPTAKRQEDTRKRGQVAKSQELYNAVSLITIFLLMRIYGRRLAENFLNIFRWVYEALIPTVIKPVNGDITIRDMHIIILAIIRRYLLMLLPILLVSFVIAFIVNLLQVKWKVSWEPMKPKFSKLNPISGFKRFFSVQKLVELAKAVLKIAVVSMVCYSFLRDKLGILLLMQDFSVNTAVSFTVDTITNLGLRIGLVYLIVGFADYAYTRWKHHNDIKMTKQEVKDEMKDSEGNPEIKSKIRQKMMQASRARMMQAVPEADVVITNPTHYAVALKYDAQVASAPIVVAKGQDYMAQKIKELARENDVEIVENKPLARMLYANVDVDALVPPELYQAVAEVLAFVYNLKKEKAS